MGAAQDLAAPLYAQVLAEAARRLGPTAAYHAMWPRTDVAPPWSHLAARLYAEVRLMNPSFVIFVGTAMHSAVSKVVYPLCSPKHACGKHTLCMRPEVVFLSCSNLSSRALHAPLQAAQLPVAWVDCEGGRWVAPCRALLPDEACARSPLLAAALSREGMPLVTGLPPVLLQAWREAMPGVQAVSPAAVRAHLRAKGPRLALVQLPGEKRFQVGLVPLLTELGVLLLCWFVRLLLPSLLNLFLTLRIGERLGEGVSGRSQLLL